MNKIHILYSGVSCMKFSDSTVSLFWTEIKTKRERGFPFPHYIFNSGNHNSAGNTADKEYYSQVFSGKSCCRINGKTCSLGICSTRANSSYSKFSAS